MNQELHPSLATSDAIAGMVFEGPPAVGLKADDRQDLEKDCVDLIGRLEYILANANAMSRVDFIDESATVGAEMLSALLPFCDRNLDGMAQEQAIEEITRCQTTCDTFEEVLKTRPIGNAILRAFWKADESPEIEAAREQLGESLSRACAATLYHAIMRVGFDTPIGKQIDASAVVFVNQLKESW